MNNNHQFNSTNFHVAAEFLYQKIFVTEDPWNYMQFARSILCASLVVNIFNVGNMLHIIVRQKNNVDLPSRFMKTMNADVDYCI